jgi:hypothetical protein
VGRFIEAFQYFVFIIAVVAAVVAMFSPGPALPRLVSIAISSCLGAVSLRLIVRLRRQRKAARPRQ